MLRDYKILLFTNDQKLQDKLKVILDFLGEPCISVDSKTWDPKKVDPKELLAVIVGLKSKTAKEIDIIKQLDDFSKEVPLILLTPLQSKTKFNKSTEDKIVAKLKYEFSHAELLNALYHCQVILENNRAVDNNGKNQPVSLFRSLVGKSDKIKKVRAMIEKVADSEANVLILGESGTGKEVVARNLHYNSRRQGKPFVAINCGAIPHDLLESELFGHEKGAFTGAHIARKGKFELANEGTIFLDEIGDMPKPMQVKLLRVLQERSFEKVGGNKTIEIDVRVIAATHRNLKEEMRKGTFREDLYYRLNVFPIEVPSLRERIEDLPLLISELLARISGQGRETIKVLDEAIEQLGYYSWPGNVRELANVMERLCIIHPKGIIGKDDLADRFKNIVPNINKSQKNAILSEKDLIEQALVESGWDLEKAAYLLNLRTPRLMEKIKQYKLHEFENIY